MLDQHEDHSCLPVNSSFNLFSESLHTTALRFALNQRIGNFNPKWWLAKFYPQVLLCLFENPLFLSFLIAHKSFGFIVVGSSIDKRPFPDLQFHWLGMLNFTLEVVLKLAWLAASNKCGRLQYLALHFCHLVIQLNLPLFEFLRSENLIYQFAGALESILRVFDFVSINVSHLLLILSEIIGQTCLMAEFWDQVNCLSLSHWIFHVDKKQWLVGFRDLLLVNSEHVVNHIGLKFLQACLGLHGPFEEIGLGRLVFGIDEAINLVSPGVILGQNSLTGHAFVAGVEQVADVFFVLPI